MHTQTLPMTCWSFRIALGSAWSLVGLQGQVVAEGRGQQREVVRTGNFANGVYVLRVANNQGLTFKQVLIQH